MRELLRTNRDLRWLFVAQVVSFMGDWFTFVALAGLVKDATGSEFLVALAYVSFSLPSFLASPVAGPVADRIDRRTLLLVVSGAQALAAVGLLTASVDRIWPLFVFQGLISGLAAFVKPAIDAGVPNLARTPEELRKANTLFGSTWGVMLAVGAALGGVFSQTFGRRNAFIADAVSFVIAVALFSLIRRPMQQPVHGQRKRIRVVEDMKEAGRYARRDHAVLALLASKATFGIGAGTVAQLPVLATEVFKWGDGGTGILLGARGVGVGLGPIIASRLVRGRMSKVLQICGLSGLAFGVFYTLGGWAPVIYLSAAAVALAHLGGGAQWTLSTYGLQVRAPDEIRGRVMAGDFAIVTLVTSISSLLAGMAAETIGVRWTITVFAGIASLASAGYLFMTRTIIAGLRAEELVGTPHAT